MNLFNWIRKCFGKQSEVDVIPLAIAKFSINGEHIKTYASIQEVASESYNMNLIKDCIEGKRDSYKGYIWKEINVE